MVKSQRTLFFNGKILTMKPGEQAAGAMLIQGGKIEGTGQDESDFVGCYERKYDLKGMTVMPGFNDSHLHLTGIGEAMETVDLTGVEDIASFQKKIKTYIQEMRLNSDKWITGRGWNQNRFPDQKMPNRKIIDKVTRDYPVFLKRSCFHIGVVNSRALELAGIDKVTPDPPGGKIDRDPTTGKPTGILRENAMGLVESIIPEPGPQDFKRWIKNATIELSKTGLTSIQTDDFGNYTRFEKGYQAYKELHDAGELPVRINLQVRMGKINDFSRFISETGFKTGSGDEFLAIGPCKILSDGSMGGRTAALFEPYSDKPDTQGTLIYTPEELEDYVKLAAGAGFQLAIHGIGDRAISEIIRIYEKVYKTREEIAAARPRLIHGQLTNKKLIKKMKKLGMAVDIQPIFLNSDLHMAEARVGKERLEGSYAWKSMYEMGIPLGGSSDAPVETFKPLAGIYAAVTRKDLTGYPESGWRSREAMTVEQALDIYTRGSAYNSFSEGIKGELTAGKLADFIILSDDPTTVKPDQIKQIEVLATFVGGKEVYSKL